mgnify:FL=1
MAQMNFNAATVAPQQSFKPLPAGVYSVVATDSEVKPTKNGTGQVAQFTMQVVEGEHTGRKIFARFNIANQNPEAERIGQSQFSAFCHAAGVLQVSDTAQLHGRPVRAKVKIRKDASGQYEDSNEISGFEMGATGPTAPAIQSPVAAPAAAATAPWKRAAA